MQRAYMKKKRALDAKDRKKALDAKNRRRENNRKTPQQKSSQQCRRITANKKAGASHVFKCNDKNDDWHYDYEQDTLGLLGEDTTKETTPNAAARQRAAPEADAACKDIGECGICYDVKNVMPLMKTCNHAKSCYDCFRAYYVVQAQSNVGNYPLRCWHPACSFRLLHDEQIQQFVRSPKEMQRHYGLSIMARAQKQGKMVVHCPNCDHPRALALNQNGGRVFSCLQCQKLVAVMLGESERALHQCLFRGGRRALAEFQETIRTLESLERDKVGENDGWALCPSCKIIISKGDGWDDMRCACGKHFSWDEAVECVKKIRRYAGCLVADPTFVP